MSTQIYAMHPIMLAKCIREAIGKMPQKEAAVRLGITPQYLNDILKARRNISAKIAAKLHLFGLPGLELFLGQEMHSYLCAAYHTEDGDPIGTLHFDHDEQPIVRQYSRRVG